MALKISAKAENIAYIKAGIGTIIVAVVSGIGDPLMEWLVLDSGLSITWISFYNSVFQAVAMVTTFWVIKLLGTMSSEDAQTVRESMEKQKDLINQQAEATEDEEGKDRIRAKKAKLTFAEYQEKKYGDPNYWEHQRTAKKQEKLEAEIKEKKEQLEMELAKLEAQKPKLKEIKEKVESTEPTPAEPATE